jgi:hypothetical protein
MRNDRGAMRLFRAHVLIAAGLFGVTVLLAFTGDARSDAAADIAATPSRGTLVARPGMTVAEITRRSSLALNVGRTVIADGTIFTFEVADTAISFPRCRYYFMTYASGDASRIDMMSIGTASRMLSRPELEVADAALRERLAADGWLAGHEVYRDEQDRRLHGGASEGPEGRTWLKDDTVLTIQRRRMDEAKPGEAADAGGWIQFVDLGLLGQWSSRNRFVFGPPRR